MNKRKKSLYVGGIALLLAAALSLMTAVLICRHEVQSANADYRSNIIAEYGLPAGKVIYENNEKQYASFKAGEAHGKNETGLTVSVGNEDPYILSPRSDSTAPYLIHSKSSGIHITYTGGSTDYTLYGKRPVYGTEKLQETELPDRVLFVIQPNSSEWVQVSHARLNDICGTWIVGVFGINYDCREHGIFLSYTPIYLYTFEVTDHFSIRSILDPDGKIEEITSKENIKNRYFKDKIQFEYNSSCGRMFYKDQRIVVRDVDIASGEALTEEFKYDIYAEWQYLNGTVVYSLGGFFVDRTPPSLYEYERYNREQASIDWSSDGFYDSPVSASYSLNGIDRGAYSRDATLTEEGFYTVTVADACGNSSTAEFYIDRTPTTLEYERYNGNDASVDWSVGYSESPVIASYSLNGLDKGGYSSGTSLSEEGLYTVTATDACGNSSVAEFIIDKTAPALKTEPGDSAYSRKSVAVSWAKPENFEAPITATVRRNGEAAAQYVSGTEFTEEGEYVFEVSDAAGNLSSITMYIDRTPPGIEFTARGSSFDKYTREPFTAAATDSIAGVDRLQIYSDGVWRDYDYAAREKNGEYLFRAIDFAGNIKSGTAIVFRSDTFGNAAAIRDGYKVNSWYTVSLPARIFTTPQKDEAGRYSFETYDEALEFAKAKEREYRVSKVQGGYMYVSAVNETIAQKYTDEGTLNSAIDTYARKYISNRIALSENGKDNIFNEPSSLTRNRPTLPAFLGSYSSMPAHFIKRDVLWTLPDIEYIRGMPYSVTAIYLGDIAPVASAPKEIPRGMTLNSALGDDYKQGWYLITESDDAGNIEKYLVYSDAELPTISALVGYGNCTREIDIDYSFTVNNPTYFISLDIKALLDNADEYITLKLEKGNNVYYYTQSDELPYLGGDEFGSGKYTLTVFDRALNTLIFDVFIADSPPSWSHSSLAADRSECTVTFNLSDRYCALTSLEVYKVEYDGSKTVLEVDDYGTPVNAMTLSYKLTVGGKYGATVTDNYGRTTYLTEIFFLKGLPSGKLTGVKDGGRTNRNVSVTFNSADVCELYTVVPGGDRLPFSDYTVQIGATETSYNITASDTTSFDYLVLLYNRADRGLYVEYTFEIDAILPDIFIADANENTVSPDGATNMPFKLYWNETGVNVRYYTARSGSLGAAKYNMNSVLSQGTLYYFTVSDDVGNTSEFTVLLDNYVDYTLSGSFNTVDGVLYTNKAVTFTVNEPTIEFSILCGNTAFGNGATLDTTGRYMIHAADNYGNVLELVLEIDYTPPKLELSGASPGEAVNGSVTVMAFDYAELFLSDSRGSRKSDIENGARITEPGTYYVTARDCAGNTVTVMFGIDVDVRYSLSVPIGAVTSGNVTLEELEELEVSTALDGEAISETSTFSACGLYVVTLTDNIGNTVELSFTIVPARARAYNIELPSGVRALSATLDGAVLELSSDTMFELTQTGLYSIALECPGGAYELALEVDADPPVITLEKDGNVVRLAGCDKDNVTLELKKDGSEITGRIGLTLEDPGHYVLTVTDELGNFSTYEFTIPYRLNTWAVVAIVVGTVALVVLLVLIIRARRKPRMK